MDIEKWETISQPFEWYYSISGDELEKLVNSESQYREPECYYEGYYDTPDGSLSKRGDVLVERILLTVPHHTEDERTEWFYRSNGVVRRLNGSLQSIFVLWGEVNLDRYFLDDRTYVDVCVVHGDHKAFYAVKTSTVEILGLDQVLSREEAIGCYKSRRIGGEEYLKHPVMMDCPAFLMPSPRDSDDEYVEVGVPPEIC